MLPHYFDPLRERIAATLHRFFLEKKEELDRVNPLGRDAAERLVEFTLRGKMVRPVQSRVEAVTGSLVGEARAAIRALGCGMSDEGAALQGLLDFTITRSQ
jgi:hypothetical protein